MRKPPKQERSIATEQRMLDAAEELLDNGNAKNVTVENVLRLSGATVGSFYARFGSVEGLFNALHERYLDSIQKSKNLEELKQGIEKQDLKSSLQRFCKILYQFAYEERKLIAYFITHPTSESHLIRQVSVDSMLKILKTHKNEVVHPDLQRTSENTTRLIYQVIFGIVFLEPSEFIGRSSSLSNLIDTTTHMSFAYLTTE